MTMIGSVALAVVIAVFIIITVIVWLIHLIRRKKKVALAVISCLTVFVIAFCLIFPTSFPFVDSWIIGTSFDEIVSVYGDNYKEGITKSGVRCIYYWIYRRDLTNYWYVIYLDDSDIAVRVLKKEIQPLRRGCIV